MSKKGGWFKHSPEHGLAAKGIKTKQVQQVSRRKGNRLIQMDKAKWDSLTKALDEYEEAGDKKAAKNIRQQLRDAAEPIDGKPMTPVEKEVDVEVESQSNREQEKAKWS